MPSWGPIVLVVVVPILFAVGFTTTWRYTHSLSTAASWANREQVQYRSHALVREWLRPPGLWSPKTLMGMEIRVGPGFVWVTTSIDGVADALGCQWFYSPGDCAVKVLRAPKAPRHRSWLVIEGASGSRHAKIKVSPDGGVARFCEALAAAGFRVDGDGGTTS